MKSELKFTVESEEESGELAVLVEQLLAEHGTVSAVDHGPATQTFLVTGVFTESRETAVKVIDAENALDAETQAATSGFVPTDVDLARAPATPGDVIRGEVGLPSEAVVEETGAG